MKTVNKDLKKYYGNIKKALLGSTKDKKRLLCDIKNRVNDFLADNPNATVYTIEKHFGTPQLVADEFNAYLTADEIKVERTKKILKYILFALAAIALIVVIITATYIIIETYTDRPMYFEESIDDVTITETEDIENIEITEQ